VTREKIDTLLEWLDKLGLGTNDVDAVRKLQSAQSDAPPFELVLSVPLVESCIEPPPPPLLVA